MVQPPASGFLTSRGARGPRDFARPTDRPQSADAGWGLAFCAGLYSTEALKLTDPETEAACARGLVQVDTRNARDYRLLPVPGLLRRTRARSLNAFAQQPVEQSRHGHILTTDRPYPLTCGSNAAARRVSGSPTPVPAETGQAEAHEGEGDGFGNEGEAAQGSLP